MNTPVKSHLFSTNVKITSLFLVLQFFAWQSHAESFHAELFEQNSNFTKKLFRVDITTKQEDTQILNTAKYTDLAGKVAVEEVSTIQGADLLKFEMDQKQTGEKGRIEVQGQEVLFFYEKGDKKKTAKEKLRHPLVATGNFVPFVQSRFADLLKGETISMRFAVWDRLETVGFKIFKVEEATSDQDPKKLRLRMKPSSALISALVKPIDFWFDKESKKLLVMDGRVAPKLSTKSGFKDLDAEVKYTY